MLMNRIGGSLNDRSEKKEGPNPAVRPSSFFRLPSVRDSLLHESHGQGCATIEAPRLLTRVVVLRPLLAVADRLQAIGADAAAHEIVLHRGGAALAEGEVVLRRADVARVSFDLHAHG